MRHSSFEYNNPKQTRLFEKSPEEKEREERDSIGSKYNIYGDARERMIKKDGVWYLDGRTVEEHKEMMDRTYEKDGEYYKN